MPRGAASHRLVCKAAKESATGVEFPDSCGALQCLGTGVRTKKIAFLGVNVYAMALYADAAGVKAEGGSLEGAYDKAMCLQLVRDVDAATFMEALNEGVRPRLARIATDMATAENEDGNFMAEVAEAAEKAEEAAFDQLDELGDFFLSKGKLSNGTKVLLSFPAGAGMQVTTGDVFSSAPELQLGSNELGAAVIDVWIGDDPIEPAALANFQAGAKAC